jgi:hypothetical protein
MEKSCYSIDTSNSTTPGRFVSIKEEFGHIGHKDVQNVK